MLFVVGSDSLFEEIVLRVLNEATWVSGRKRVLMQEQ